MTEPNPHDMLALARRLSLDAAGMTTTGATPTDVCLKADESVVTAMDHAVQAHIVGAITTAYPDHAILAEETLPESHPCAAPGETRFCWVIDPVDGTRNYAGGFPFFSTSIAVLDRADPIVAVIVEHNLRQVYTAVKGEGATLDNTPIRAAGPPIQPDLLVGIPSSKDDLTVRVLTAWTATNGLVLRNTGSSAMHLAMVATGALDGAFAKRCKIWDVAAGILLINEAHRRVTTPFGQPIIPFDLTADPNDDVSFLAASPTCFDRLLKSIGEAASE